MKSSAASGVICLRQKERNAQTLQSERIGDLLESSTLPGRGSSLNRLRRALRWFLRCLFLLLNRRFSCGSIRRAQRSLRLVLAILLLHLDRWAATVLRGGRRGMRLQVLRRFIHGRSRPVCLGFDFRSDGLCGRPFLGIPLRVHFFRVLRLLLL